MFVAQEEDYVSCVIDENSASSMMDGGAKTPTLLEVTEKPGPQPSAQQPQTNAVKTVPAPVAFDDSPKEMVIVKQEPQQSNGSAAGTSSDGFEPVEPSADVCQPKQEPSPGDPAKSAGNKRGGTTAKYCKVCDISFNYLSTFIAHKKYYCRNSTEYKCNAENAKTATVT